MSSNGLSRQSLNRSGDKKLSPEKLAEQLESGAELVKAVYR
jgi:hypothetical protein